MTDLTGRTLDDRYRVVRRLGRGNFGEVYLAEHLAFGEVLREVALKLWFAESDREAVQEAIRESVSLARLVDSPSGEELGAYLIGIYDAGLIRDLGGRPACSLEFAGGGNLASEIKRYRPFPVRGAVRYMRQIAAGMSLLHGMDPPCVHRDLKPDNILLTAGRRIKIGDFGLASLIDKVLEAAPAAGALSYQAPESLIGGTCTPASDVYSMGLVFYEMLTGTNPFGHIDTLDRGDTGRTVLNHIQARRNPEFLRRPSEVSVELRDHPGIEKIVTTCLEYSPEDRYPSAGRVFDELAGWERGAFPSAPQKRGQTPGSLLEEGIFHSEHGDLARALDCWNRVIVIDPGLPDPYVRIVDALVSDGRAAEAVRAGLAGLKQAKRRGLCTAVARAYEALGNAALASSFYREAERCDQ